MTEERNFAMQRMLVEIDRLHEAALERLQSASALLEEAERTSARMRRTQKWVWWFTLVALVWSVGLLVAQVFG